MVSVNNTIIKKCFQLYDDTSIYQNYSNIAYKYNKLLKDNKDKKSFQENPEKLREDVKKWLFSQSLESRLKICTVENEHYGKIIYQMIYQTKLDKSMNFKTKPNFFQSEDDTDTDEEFTKNINKINDYNKSENEIKITKTNKDGKKNRGA